MSEQEDLTASTSSMPIFREEVSFDVSQIEVHSSRLLTLTDVAQSENLSDLADALNTTIPEEELIDLTADERKDRAEQVLRIRNAAFDRVFSFANDHKHEKCGEALEILNEYVPEHGTSYMKSETCRLLTKHPEHSETLMKLMGDPYQNGIRNYAANVLRFHIKAHPEIGDVLLDYVEGTRRFENPIPRHRFTEVGVSLALLNGTSQRALGYLENVLQSRDSDEYAKILAKTVKNRANSSQAA